jgi:hypothetical protein
MPPLSDDLGFTSMTPSGQLILKGQYDAAHLDASVQLLIQHLHQNSRAATHECQPSIDYAAFEGKMAGNLHPRATIRPPPWTL